MEALIERLKEKLNVWFLNRNINKYKEYITKLESCVKAYEETVKEGYVGKLEKRIEKLEKSIGKLVKICLKIEEDSRKRLSNLNNVLYQDTYKEMLEELKKKEVAIIHQFLKYKR